jgi:hypothetical protein
MLAKGTSMSEQKSSFMVELDMWSSENVVSPLYLACMRGPEEAIVEAKEVVKKAIRTKVLESYHNGQAAGPRKAYAPTRRAHGL